MNNRISEYYSAKDELDRPVVDVDGDGPPTMLDELMEDSDRIFHKDAAAYQVSQHKRLREYEKTLYVWGDEQFNKGMDALAIDNAINTELVKMRQLLHYETQQYLRILDQQLRTRNEGIGLFVLHKITTGEG